MLRDYRRSWLRGDLIAGVTVAAYLIPQVMAYATVAGVPPVAGLWAALPALVIYAVLGSSSSLSMGPEATTALMTAIAIGPLATGDPARYAGLAATLALLVGAMSVGAWLLRLGFVADLLSRPVLVGYLAGVAVIMIADQLRRVTGVPVTGQTFLAQVGSFARGLGQMQPATVAVAAAPRLASALSSVATGRPAPCGHKPASDDPGGPTPWMWCSLTPNSVVTSPVIAPMSWPGGTGWGLCSALVSGRRGGCSPPGPPMPTGSHPGSPARRSRPLSFRRCWPKRTWARGSPTLPGLRGSGCSTGWPASSVGDGCSWPGMPPMPTPRQPARG